MLFATFSYDKNQTRVSIYASGGIDAMPSGHSHGRLRVQSDI